MLRSLIEANPYNNKKYSKNNYNKRKSQKHRRYQY